MLRNDFFADEVRMKRNVISILLLVCSVLVLLGGGVLYYSLTRESAAPAPSASPAQPAAPEETEEQENTLLIGEDEPEEPETPVEIISGESKLDPAYDFSFTDRSGVEHTLSEFVGKPMIINFWATWCGPCQAELPHFDRAYARYGDQIHFLMMDLVDGSYETESATISFADAEGYQFPLYFDSRGEGSLAFQIEAIPLTVVFDAEGSLVTTHLGSMSEADLQQLIDMVYNG